MVLCCPRGVGSEDLTNASGQSRPLRILTLLTRCSFLLSNVGPPLWWSGRRSRRLRHWPQALLDSHLIHRLGHFVTAPDWCRAQGQCGNGKHQCSHHDWAPFVQIVSLRITDFHYT